MTSEAHGPPSEERLPSVAVLVDAATVRASSAAEGRRGSATSVRGGAMVGASPGSPWSRVVMGAA
ncbi:hypothetical protein [Tsukamurella tyrosinosolvens]|uniref:hypothetical protein n=1 Tax=Tsukamurella tyrosinosolvens TaxID=57704 RepID=UPI001FCFA5BC|nr:hypothetical protein [Tsukamurella tyrosinosolvens]